jgi:hypothetical protein
MDLLESLDSIKAPKNYFFTLEITHLHLMVLVMISTIVVKAAIGVTSRMVKKMGLEDYTGLMAATLENGEITNKMAWA